MGKAMAMLLVLLQVLAVMAQACGGADRSSDRCSLKVARGCGTAGHTSVRAQDAFITPMCYVADTVVTAALTDVWRLPHAYVILVEMPGVRGSDVKVEVLPWASQQSILSIAGVAREEHGRGRWRDDRGALTKLFARKFVLPQHVDAGRISHQLDDGLLRVTVPLVVGFGFDEQEAESEERTVLPAVGAVRSSGYCTTNMAEELIQPEALGGYRAACGGDSQVITIPPFLDMWNRPDSYVIVVEMPGVRPGAVNVEITQSKRDLWDLLFGPRARDGKGSSIVSVTGVTQDEDEGQARRLERGGANTKEFALRLSFPPKYPVGANATYHVSDGLVKVTLPKAVPSLWESTLDRCSQFLRCDVYYYYNRDKPWSCILY
ncbi:hypothetical protein SELMODRAFT_427722 [Selaginella moellendorffii]|uniref:SHSP domain-containing protein n=1 Tax=Selaginella moellendorffii TaxID=88036 RepID=D8T0I3_SELML|nr:hypothetical protein SELMODRAFT_427722 [Selaginella moellendorffii]